MNQYTPISELIIHPSVRPQQQRTYDKIQQKWKQFHSFFCALPTGSGKTDLAACLLSDYLKNTGNSEKIDILVSRRTHQDFWLNIVKQYGKRHAFSVAVLKGRSAYYCPIVKSGANFAPCAFDYEYAKTCRERSRCDLLEARRQIRKAKVRILNWWVFKYVDLGEAKAAFRIFDEAHNLLNLESLVRVEIKRSLLLNVCRDQGLIDQFRAWEKNRLTKNKYVFLPLKEGLNFLRDLQEVLEQREKEAAVTLDAQSGVQEPESLRELGRITELIYSINELIENPQGSDLRFIFQRIPGSAQPNSLRFIAQPFDISFIFSKLFKGSKNLFLSATIGDGEYLAKLLGLNTDHCCFIRESSAFKKENHPFVLLKEAHRLSTASKEKKMDSFRALADQTTPFFRLAHQEKLRGLILASSFELASHMEKLARAEKLTVISHTAGKSDEAVKHFISQQRGDVLISPSTWEGISLDDDLARFCLIPKLPFPMMADPIIQYKAKKYPSFIENSVLVSIQQAHGRIQRNPSDYGITICFDANFRWLRRKRAKSLEPWFTERMLELSLHEITSEIRNLIKIRPEVQSKTDVDTKNNLFSRMAKEDQNWLKTSGLADLLSPDND